MGEERDQWDACKKAFVIEVMLCFWFAVHMNCLPEAKYLYSLDPIIAQIMKTLREHGLADIEKWKLKASAKRSAFGNSIGDNAESMNITANDAEADGNENEEKIDYKWELESKKDLRELKFLLVTKEYLPFISPKIAEQLTQTAVGVSQIATHTHTRTFHRTI